MTKNTKPTKKAKELFEDEEFDASLENLEEEEQAEEEAMPDEPPLEDLTKEELEVDPIAIDEDIEKLADDEGEGEEDEVVVIAKSPVVSAKEEEVAADTEEEETTADDKKQPKSVVVKCPHCGEEVLDMETCPLCGNPLKLTADTELVHDDDDELDLMEEFDDKPEKAQPNLANDDTLFEGLPYQPEQFGPINSDI
jgi:hypothetical protein